MSRIKLFLPVLLFFVMAGFLLFGLGNDPKELPSVLIGKPMPEFDLPTLESSLSETLSNEQLVGEPLLMNIWATWCATCLVEHPYFLELEKRGVKILGINYKDDSDEAVKWLARHGNPFSHTVVDANGRLGFDLGVTGAPETFLVNAQGEIIYRHVGVVNDAVWQEHFAETFAKNGIAATAEQ